MRKLAPIVAVLVLLAAMPPKTALSSEKSAIDSLDRYIGVTYDFSYHTQWLSKGVQGYGKQGAAFNTINLDF